MKIRNMLTILLVMVVSCATAQTNWEELCEKSPKTALAEAEKMYAEALKANNGPKLIQATIIKINCKALIDEATFPQMLAQTEEIIKQSRDSVEKSILHSLCAELYLFYYQKKSYELNSRTALDSFPADINEWSGNLFIRKIFSHALAALTPALILQQTNINTYQDILIIGNDARLLRPTVYDFLCHRSIVLLSDTRGNINTFFEQHPAPATQMLYQDINGFIQEQITVYPYDITSNILNIYQQLLLFRSQANLPNALLIADLERLNYVHGLSDRSDRNYQDALQKLLQQFSEQPYSIEILNNIVQNNNSDAYRQTQPERANQLLQESISLCENGISRFPNYPRISLLKQQIENIKHSNLQFNFSGNIYPQQYQEIKITYKNISDYKIELFKLEGYASTYIKDQDSSKTNFTRKSVWSGTFYPAPTLVMRDTTLSIPVPSSGPYEIVVSSSNIRSSKQRFVSTSLIATVQKTGTDKQEFIVRDQMSGKPVAKARIDLYDYTYPNYTLRQTLYTNEKGIAYATTKNRTSYYTVTDKQNPTGILYGMPYYFHSPGKKNEDVFFVTDRKIYRPGQTVYYSGISWLATPDTSYARTAQKYDVMFYNANHQLLTQQHVTTNKFGSFSGSFQIPEGVLNGRFTIQIPDYVYQDITVADYQRPKFEISLKQGQTVNYTGDTVILKGHVQNYTGVAQANSTVNYQIFKQSLFRWRSPETPIEQGVVSTNEQGNFEIRFVAEASTPPDLAPYALFSYKVTASVTDERGETQQVSMHINTSRRNRNLFVDIPEQISLTEDSVKIQIQTETESPLTYRISRLAPLKKLGDSYDVENTVIETVIQQGNIPENHRLIRNFNSYKPGAYLIEVKSVKNDSLSQPGKAIFYLYSPKDKRPPILTYNWMIPEKTECLTGETARIQLGSSAKDVHVMYEIYTATQRIKQEQFILSDEIKTIQIPYQKEFGGEICVVFSYVKDRQFFTNTILVKQLQPEKNLTFKTKVFRDKLNPGQKEMWEFVIENHKKQGVASEVMAVMYDASLDALAANYWNFDPRFIYRLPYTSWQDENLHIKNNSYVNFPAMKKWDIPTLDFDRLNLLKLRNYMIFNTALYGADEASPVYMTQASRSSKVQYDKVANTEAEAGVESTAGGASATPDFPVTIRENFQETAFFYPQLLSDSNGVVRIQFTVPEALTRWKFMAIAHTPDIAHGFIQEMITTSKDFMVNPLVPRFFRSGDQTVLKTTINNLSANRQSGNAYIELFIPGNDKIILRQDKTFDIPAGQNATVSFNFMVPENINVIGYRVVAGNNRFSDGEQNLIPVVSNYITLTEALPFFSTEKGTHSYTLKNSSTTRKDIRLTVEATANPIWYAVLALPNLQVPLSDNVTEITAAYYVNTIAATIARSNPKILATIQEWKTGNDRTTLLSQLEKNSELKNVLLETTPWALDAQNETERMQALSQLFDENRLAYLQSQALQKLVELQDQNGGWSWFKGMYSNRFMTTSVLVSLAKTSLTGQIQYGEKEKMMQIKGLRYLDNATRKDFENDKNKKRTINYDQLFYLYMRSMYRDIPLGDALDAHKYFMGLTEKQWPDFSLYEKAITATFMWNYGKQDIAREILRSLQEYATTTPESGMFWANNRTGSFYNSAIMTQSAIIEAFYEIKGDSPDLKLMKQWLLCQKQAQNWGSTPNTVDAI